MDLSAAAALCLWLLSACRPRDGLEAAAVLRAAGAGPAESPGGGGGGGGTTLAEAAGASAAPAAASPGPRGARRATGSGFRNGSVVPHQFMMSLYRSLAGRTPAGPVAASTSGSGRHGRADTVTGFADQATPGTLPLPRPSILSCAPSTIPLGVARGASVPGSGVRKFSEAHAPDLAAPGLWLEPRQLAGARAPEGYAHPLPGVPWPCQPRGSLRGGRLSWRSGEVRRVFGAEGLSRGGGVGCLTALLLSILRGGLYKPGNGGERRTERASD